MATVLLVNPPSETLGPGNKRLTEVLYPSPPGGLASLGACLLDAGHSAGIVDLVTEPRDLEQLVAQVARVRPDMIGFSVLGPAFDATQQLMRELKERFPSVRLVAGNALPSEYPDWFLRQVPWCDAVVVGEAERTIVELADAADGGQVDGVRWQGSDPKDFRPRAQIQDLDSLPFPAWQLLPYWKYRASPQLMMRSKPTIGILQSRGCPWDCGFCAQNYLWPNVRLRSIDSVADEAERNLKDFGIANYGLYDSIFPLKKDYGEQLYRAYEARNLLGKIQFFCETRVDLIWEDTFRWLKKAGLHLVFLGIESPNADLLKNQAKIKKMYDIRRSVETLRGVGLRTYGLFVIGLPGETAEDRRVLRDFACDMPFDVASFGIYTHYAGSPASRERGGDPAELTRGNWGPEHGDIAKAQRDLMRAFYLRPSFIAKTLWRREITLDRMLVGAKTLATAAV